MNFLWASSRCCWVNVRNRDGGSQELARWTFSCGFSVVFSSKGSGDATLWCLVSTEFDGCGFILVAASDSASCCMFDIGRQGKDQNSDIAPAFADWRDNPQIHSYNAFWLSRNCARIFFFSVCFCAASVSNLPHLYLFTNYFLSKSPKCLPLPHPRQILDNGPPKTESSVVKYLRSVIALAETRTRSLQQSRMYIYQRNP